MSRPRHWTMEKLAHVCDVAATGVESRTPFAGNPAFVEGLRMAAKVLRGDVGGNIVKVRISERSDGRYLLLKLKD